MSIYLHTLLVDCSSLFVTLVECVVARSVTTATMDSAAVFSSVLGLVSAALLPMAMVHTAASSTPLFVTSVQMFAVAVGPRFVVAASLRRKIALCRASHRLLALARTVPAPATRRRPLLKSRRHQSSKPRCRLLKPWR